MRKGAYAVTHIDPDLPTSKRSADSDAVRSVGSRVVVLYEPGRSGLAALDLARRLVLAEGCMLTVVAVAPQDARMCCGAGSAVDYNRAVRDAADCELQDACELLGPVGKRASFRLLVQDKDPPLTAWVAGGEFDLVLLPARKRPLRREKHPAADQLCRSTGAEVRVVDAGSSFEQPSAPCRRPENTDAPDGLRHPVSSLRVNPSSSAGSPAGSGGTYGGSSGASRARAGSGGGTRSGR
jgi:hypothetical protein